MRSDITAARGTTTFQDTGERYMAMLALARRYPDAKVLFTGGGGKLAGGVPPETDTIRLLLREQGMPEDRVLYDDRPHDTRERGLRDGAGAARARRALAAGHLGRPYAAAWAASGPSAGS